MKQKNDLKSVTDTHKIRKTNRVKVKKPDTKNVFWAGCQPRVKLRKESKQKYGHKKKRVQNWVLW